MPSSIQIHNEAIDMGVNVHLHLTDQESWTYPRHTRASKLFKRLVTYKENVSAFVFNCEVLIQAPYPWVVREQL